MGTYYEHKRIEAHEECDPIARGRSEPMNTALALLLPVLAAFVIINDPTVQDRLFGDCSWFCSQSWAVWTALVTLMMFREAVFQFG